MNKKLRAGASVVALLGLVGLSACGDDAKSDGAVALRMTVWTSNPDQLKLLDGIAADYTAAHPNVKVAYDPIPFENYTTTLQTQIAGGKAPDLAWVLETSAKDFVSSGVLAPLEDTFKATDGYMFEDLSPTVTELWKADGKLVAYPFSTSPFGVYVNTDMVKKAGQKTPDELRAAGTWDWETAMAVASATAKSSGKAGLVVRDFEYKTWPLLATIWRGWRADAWSADGKTCGFDSPEMLEAMTFLHRSVFKDNAMPAPGVAADFFAGEAAMTVAQLSRAALLKDAKFGWDLVPLPTGPKGEYAVVGQAGIGVLAKGNQANAAAEFLAFFSNPTNSAKLAQYFPPPRTSLLTAETLAKANPLLKPDQLQDVVIDGISTGAVLPNRAGQAEIANTVRSALDPLWQPGADVKAVLADVCSKAQPLLAR
jgi:multiple sugar transport system substrate-binding protein